MGRRRGRLCTPAPHHAKTSPCASTVFAAGQGENTTKNAGANSMPAAGHTHMKTNDPLIVELHAHHTHIIVRHVLHSWPLDNALCQQEARLNPEESPAILADSARD